MRLIGPVVDELWMFSGRIAHHEHSNKYLPFVVFRAGCYGAMLLQRAIIMTPFGCNALQRALNWNIKRITHIEAFKTISRAKVLNVCVGVKLSPTYSSHCGAYAHIFPCMYFHVSSSHFLACNRPVITLRSRANHWRPSKALSIRLHGGLVNCKALSRL